MAVHDKVWPWTLGNTVRLTFAWWKMAPCIRSALACMMLTFCAWYYPRVLRETGAKTCETGAKKRETGAKKKCTTWPSCFDGHDVSRVLKTLYAHSPNRRHGPKRRRRHVVLSLWGAYCFSLSLASSSIAPFSSCIGFIPVLLGLPVRMFLDFVACSVHVMYVMYLLVVTVVFLCWMLNALHEDSSCEKHIAGQLMWCCENCAIAEGCLLEVSWPMKNIRDVEVDTVL